MLVYAVIVKGTMDDVGAQQPCFPEAWCRGETVGGGQRPSPAPDARDLMSLADESGGHHDHLTNRADLAVVRALQRTPFPIQVLGVTPLMLDGKVHTLQVRVKRQGSPSDRAGLISRARTDDERTVLWIGVPRW